MSLIDSLVVPASLHDVEGRFLHMNAAAERASGKLNAEMLGLHYTDLLPPEEQEKVATQYGRAAEPANRPTSSPCSLTAADATGACAPSTFRSARTTRSSAC